MAQGSNARRGSAALAETRDTPMDRLGGTILQVDGEPVHIGKLSLNQILTLARVLAEAVARMGTAKREEVRKVLEKDGEKDEEARDTRIKTAALLVLDVLDEVTVGKVFATVLDREEAWCLQHLGAVDALNILDGVLEHNDWEQIQKAFLAIQARIRPPKQKS